MTSKFGSAQRDQSDRPVALNEQDNSAVTTALRELRMHGIVVLPKLFTAEQLLGMQAAFRTRLQGLRISDFDGFEKTELHRLMVEEVLTLDQGFVDAALNPLVKQILKAYIGDRFELVEARGWRSLPTKRDFHGWHGDGWYDQEAVKTIPREVKLALYLTDVRSGAFNYIRDSHQKQHPRPIRTAELGEVNADDLVEVLGEAGTAFLFDTSGVHRQGVPVLEPREAVFFNYHDPEVPLDKEDRESYRYHPLILNSAFLGNLSPEDQRILGFGNKVNFVPAFQQPPRNRLLHRMFAAIHDLNLRVGDLNTRIQAKYKQTLGHRG